MADLLSEICVIIIEYAADAYAVRMLNETLSYKAVIRWDLEQRMMYAGLHMKKTMKNKCIDIFLDCYRSGMSFNKRMNAMKAFKKSLDEESEGGMKATEGC